MMKPAQLAAFAVILFAGSALGQTVTDGDTIKLNGTTYRIWGIDAAESKQACADGWPAGKEATAAMRELVKGRTITCEAKERAAIRAGSPCMRTTARSLGTGGRASAIAHHRFAPLLPTEGG